MSNGHGAEYCVTNRRATRQGASRPIALIAEAVRSEAAANTPRGDTGNLRRGWRTVPGRDPGTTLVFNDAVNTRGKPYAHYVEYGTRRQRARPMLGPVVARYRRQVSR